MDDKFNIDRNELITFLNPLVSEGLVIQEKDFVNSESFGERNVRTVEFFQSFFSSQNTTQNMMEKLLGSSILILGLGGVGTWVVEMLARLGVKKLVIIDPDVVEISNIQRQAIFCLNDIGRKKIDVVSEYCLSVSKEIEIVAFSEHISTAKSLVCKIKDVDLVINCADKPDVDITNAIVTRACFKKSTPHILCGGYDGHSSFLGQTVIPHKTSCWFCYADSGIYEDMLDGFEITERKNGNLVGGTICPIGVQIASFQVQEAVRLLTGCSEPVMINRKAEVDFQNLSYSFTEIPKLIDCKICGVKK